MLQDDTRNSSTKPEIEDDLFKNLLPRMEDMLADSTLDIDLKKTSSEWEPHLINGFRDFLFKLKHRKNFTSITNREKEILQLLAEGKNNREIGGELSISYHTVRTHRNRINRKLAINSERQLYRFVRAFHVDLT